MPHLVFEYTANLEADGRLQELVNGAAAVLVAQQEGGKPVYPIGGVRVRAAALSVAPPRGAATSCCAIRAA